MVAVLRETDRTSMAQTLRSTRSASSHIQLAQALRRTLAAGHQALAPTPPLWLPAHPHRPEAPWATAGIGHTSSGVRL